MSIACAVSVFIIHSIITLVPPLFFKGPMSWTLIAKYLYQPGSSLGWPRCSDAYDWAPRHLLASCVAFPRPNGCPEMTRGRTLKKALKCKGPSVNFEEWRAIAEDRPEWRSRAYSRPMPPSENWSCRVRDSKDEHCITQQDTQPSQTCSGGFIIAQLFFAICWCFFATGEYNLIDLGLGSSRKKIAFP